MSKKEKGRLRVFFAEFEGDDETMQEGLRAIGAAVNKTFQPQTKVVRLLQQGNGEVPDDNLPELEDLELEEDDDLIDVTSSSKPRKSSRRPKPPTMSIVKDLDLRPAGLQSLRKFIEEKKPRDQQGQIACAVYYLAKTLELDGITPNHVFTCFKDVGRKTPPDMPQAIRVVASRKGWVDSKKQDDIKITNSGENFVEHDLPPQGNGKVAE